jgi:hypothetical protein
MKSCAGLDIQIHVFLISAPVGGEWSASRPCRLMSGESSRYPLDRRSVYPRPVLDDIEKLKFLTLWGLELRPLGHPACSQSLYRLRNRSTYLRSLSWPIRICRPLNSHCTKQVVPSLCNNSFHSDSFSYSHSHSSCSLFSLFEGDVKRNIMWCGQQR